MPVNHENLFSFHLDKPCIMKGEPAREFAGSSRQENHEMGLVVIFQIRCVAMFVESSWKGRAAMTGRVGQPQVIRWICIAIAAIAWCGQNRGTNGTKKKKVNHHYLRSEVLNFSSRRAFCTQVFGRCRETPVTLFNEGSMVKWTIPTNGSVEFDI